MASVAQETLDYNAEEKMSGEGEVKIVRPGLVWKIITEPNSNYEKKKRRGQAQKERPCPVANLCGKGVWTKANIASSMPVSQ